MLDASRTGHGRRRDRGGRFAGKLAGSLTARTASLRDEPGETGASSRRSPGLAHLVAHLVAPSRIAAGGSPDTWIGAPSRAGESLARANSTRICPAPAVVESAAMPAEIAAGKLAPDLPAAIAGDIRADMLAGKLAADLPAAMSGLVRAHEAPGRSAPGSARRSREDAGGRLAGRRAGGQARGGSARRRAPLDADGEPRGSRAQNPSNGGTGAEPPDRGIDPRGVPHSRGRPASLDRGTPIEGWEGWMDAPENLSFWWAFSRVRRPPKIGSAAARGPRGAARRAGGRLLKKSAFGFGFREFPPGAETVAVWVGRRAAPASA
ncbi:MAG TPA: hypothetical protein VGF24_37195 [Vicinamibacterales bacterium]|jgi:hypothetical protein